MLSERIHLHCQQPVLLPMFVETITVWGFEDGSVLGIVGWIGLGIAPAGPVAKGIEDFQPSLLSSECGAWSR